MEAHIPRVGQEVLQQQIQELVCFVWDNYQQVSDAVEEIFLMGVGNAYLGVKVLLVNRGMASPCNALVFSKPVVANRWRPHPQTANYASRGW